MKNKRDQVALVLVSLVLLLTMVVGPVTSGLAARPQFGVFEVDGIHGVLAPAAGGGSGA